MNYQEQSNKLSTRFCSRIYIQTKCFPPKEIDPFQPQAPDMLEFINFIVCFIAHLFSQRKKMHI